MIDSLSQLASSDLEVIASALRSGRIAPPFTAIALQRFENRETAEWLSVTLNRLIQSQFTCQQIFTVIDLLVKDRSNRVVPEEIIDIVTTGPEAGAIPNRDTAVVVRELFANAKDSVLVVGYVVYQGQKVFQALAERMAQVPSLRVQMMLNVQRSPGDTSIPEEIVKKFADHFRQYEWPTDYPIPTIFYYPQSLEEKPEKRAILHAKCVIVDKETVFVSSANFTEAAQNRNIEVGLLIHSRHMAKKIADHFEALIERGFLDRLQQK